MSSIAKIDVRVRATRGHTTVTISSHGRTASFITAGYQRSLANQPQFSTASLNAYWLAVLNLVVANLTANPLPP